MSPNTISGIIPPLVTPLTDQLELDREAMARLIEHVISGGVNGILLLGSTGETSSLTPDIRNQVISTGLSAVSGRIPVMVNITSASYLEALRMADYAAGEGAGLAALAPPYYFEMTQAELLRYYRLVADRSGIPLLLYNVPQYTKTAIEPETAWELSGHGNIVGIKESSVHFESIMTLLNGRGNRNFPVLAGMETWLSEGLQAGCDGAVSGGANLYPGLYVKLFNAFRANDPETLERCQQIINRINDKVYRVTDSPTGIIIGLKQLLSYKGICSGQMALPVHSGLSDGQKETIESLDREIELFLS